MRSWRECKLGDIANYRTGKLNSNAATENGEYPFFTCSPITAKINNFAFDEEALLLAGNNANGIFSLKYYQGKFNAYQRTYVINTAEDYKFLFYSLKLQLANLMHMSQGTATKFLTLPILNSIEISLPPLEEQKAIAEVLSSLDDKIDLLHRQNQTLESLAQTLFRQWFEDKEFDGIVGDIAKIQSGYAFKSKDFQDIGNHGVLKIKNISNSIIDIFNTDFIDSTVANKTDEKFKIFSGDILFGMTGAEIGKMGIVPKTDKNLWLNQRVGVLREKSLGAKYLAYLQITSEFGYDYIINTASGSAQPNISANEIEQCPFVKLTDDEIKKYSNEISPLFEKIVFNLGEIQTLENLRDTLLPKLLSGEARVEI